MNIVIVEDHPMTADLYENLLLNDLEGLSRVKKADSCKAAYEFVQEAVDNGYNYDIAIVDYNLPTYFDKKLFSGSDVALLLKNTFNDCKIFMITSHTEVLVIYDLIKKVKPEGITLKSEITCESFVSIVQDLSYGKMYKSDHVKQCVDDIWEKDIMVDDYNRQISTYLSKGYKLTEIEQIVPLTYSAIQKRIARMKDIFNAEDNNALIKNMIEKNYL
ncbi:response regulator [Flavobacterium sp. NRK1]|uniref:response regulator n=1 Tax=Flavobacterium sp. NRK1 TaxID=2954929 RepID=UPI002091EE92|nr:response regulator [Flavobacterium sp. NRK1]MCO6148909.1 response regulator [Flavobacterium sp. NRK1]